METLTFSEPLTIARATDLKAALLAGLQRAEGLTVRIAAGTGGDVAGLQVLCAARLWATGSSKSLVLEQEGGNGLRELARRAGFDRHEQCPAACAETCPWQERNPSWK